MCDNARNYFNQLIPCQLLNTGSRFSRIVGRGGGEGLLLLEYIKSIFNNTLTSHARIVVLLKYYEAILRRISSSEVFQYRSSLKVTLFAKYITEDELSLRISRKIHTQGHSTESPEISFHKNRKIARLSRSRVKKFAILKISRIWLEGQIMHTT